MVLSFAVARARHPMTVALVQPIPEVLVQPARMSAAGSALSVAAAAMRLKRLTLPAQQAVLVLPATPPAAVVAPPWGWSAQTADCLADWLRPAVPRRVAWACLECLLGQGPVGWLAELQQVLLPPVNSKPRHSPSSSKARELQAHSARARRMEPARL